MNMMDIKTICICGGGSLGTVCAGVFASQGIKTLVLSGHPEKWSRRVEVYDPDGKLYGGPIYNVSARPEDVIPQADLVLCCLPGYLIEETLLKIKPHLAANAMVGSIVSSTGFFFAAHDVLDETTGLFGFQRVPFISRTRTYGAAADLLGYKTSLNVAVEHCENPETFAEQLSQLFLTPVHLLRNYYEASLTNSNPILHTGRLYAMWSRHDGTPFACQSLFYREWTDEASEILLAMDAEFMKLVKALGIAEGVIPSLLDYYESTDAHSLTRKIQSIEAFAHILSPMKPCEGGWLPDYGSRYFTEDFPYGLRFIKMLAEKHQIDTPCIDRVLAWGMSKINA